MKLFRRGTTEDRARKGARLPSRLALSLTAVMLAVGCWNLPGRAQEHAPAQPAPHAAPAPAGEAPHTPDSSAAPTPERRSHQGAAEPGPGGQHGPQGGEHEVGTPAGQPNQPGHGPETGDHGQPAAGGHGESAGTTHGPEGAHAEGGHGEAGHGEGGHGEEAHSEEKSFSIHLPTWIYGGLKKWWYSGPATLNAAGAVDAQGQPIPAEQLKALQGQQLDYTYVDHHSHQHPLPKYQIKPTLGSIGESTMGTAKETITVNGQQITLLDPAVVFRLEKLFPELLVISLLTALTIAIVSFLLTRNLKRVPGRGQVLVEMIYTFFDGFVRDLIGPHYKRYLPLMVALFLYILFMNWGGLIPGWASATANINVAAGLAVVIVAYVQFEGIRVNGPIGYLKHFVGEPWWLFWLNIPLHVVGEVAKALSLTIRLFGNIFGEDVVIVILISLAVMFTKGFIPFQAPMYLLALFTGFVQALVFMILSCVYIQLFTSHGDDHGHGEEHGHAAHGEDDHLHVPSAASMPATPA